MVGCSYPNCKSRSENGTKLFLFPDDPKCRDLWIQNLKQLNFKPNHHTQLCIMHFEEDQLTYDQAGNILVKDYGVPTIFGQTEEKVSAPENRYEMLADVKMNGETFMAPKLDVVVKSEPKDDDMGQGATRGTSPSFSPDDPNSATLHALRQQVTQLSGDLRKQKRVNGFLTKKVMELEKLNSSLRGKFANAEQKRQASDNLLLKMFSEDQINFLKKSTSRVIWSKKTMRSALRLRFACGSSGYSALIDQGYPLPGERTLQRNSKALLSAEKEESDKNKSQQL